MRSAIVVASPALVASAVASWSGRDPTIALVVAAVLLHVGALVPTLGPRVEHAAGRAGIAVGRFLDILLTGAVFCALFVPAWLIAHIVAFDAVGESRGWLAPRSVVSDHQDRTRQLGADRPYSLTRRIRQRGVRPRIAAIALLVLGLVAWQAAQPFLHPRLAGLTYWSEPFAGQPGARALFDDQARYVMASDPFTKARNRDHDGAFTVTDGKRVSYQAADPELTVWFLGGSTTFGLGQRDEHTVPSEVGRLAEEGGHRLRVVNLGTNGWGTWQEAIDLARRLDAEPAPDLVVILDGVNDWSVFTRLVEDGRDPIWPWTTLARITDYPVPASDDRSAMGSAERRTSLRRFARTLNRASSWTAALAAERGIPVARFWQPTVFTLGAADAARPVLDRLDVEPTSVTEARAEYLELRSVLDPLPVDLTAALDHLDIAPYFDYAHTNEEGARVLAAAMYSHLEPVLEDLDPSG